MVKIESPNGYVFHVCNKDSEGDPIRQIALSSSNLERSKST